MNTRQLMAWKEFIQESKVAYRKMAERAIEYRKNTGVTKGLDKLTPEETAALVHNNMAGDVLLQLLPLISMEGISSFQALLTVTDPIHGEALLSAFKKLEIENCGTGRKGEVGSDEWCEDCESIKICPLRKPSTKKSATTSDDKKSDEVIELIKKTSFRRQP